MSDNETAERIMALLSPPSKEVHLTVEDARWIKNRIKELEVALQFYADPCTYHAVAFAFDRPCGEFEDDFSDNDMYDYPKPGKRARKALEDK